MSNRLPLKDRLRDHPLMAEPEEIPWCEDCGASMEFCECNAALDDGRADWEYERKRDRDMEEAE